MEARQLAIVVVAIVLSAMVTGGHGYYEEKATYQTKACNALYEQRSTL